MNYVNHSKIEILKSFNKSFFCKCFQNYISKTLSAKYYQQNKERLKKKSVKDIKMFLRKKNEKEKKQQYGRERYKKFSECEKQAY